MRILVTGDRHWPCDDLADQTVARLIRRHGPNVVIVKGAGVGVDASFAEAANKAGIEHIAYRSQPRDPGLSRLAVAVLERRRRPSGPEPR